MEMSTTKSPMLSTTHAIFRGLQDEIKGILRSLPNLVSPNLKCGLTDAHCKLSDYYYKYDKSPFYIWAACMWSSNQTHLICDWRSSVLDPCISYEGLKMDYGDDPSLSDHLEDLKADLFNYFEENYSTLLSPMPSSCPSMHVQAPFNGSPQKSFTAVTATRWSD